MSGEALFRSQQSPTSALLPAITTDRHRDADRLQSSLLDTWNTTFGALSTPTAGWKVAFSPLLLASLTAMSERAEVRMSPGMPLRKASRNDAILPSAAAQAAGENLPTDLGGMGNKQNEDGKDCEPEGSDHEDAFEAHSILGEGALLGNGVRTIDRSACYAGGMAAKLSGAGSPRSFIPAGRRCDYIHGSSYSKGTLLRGPRPYFSRVVPSRLRLEVVIPGDLLSSDAQLSVQSVELE